MDTSQVHPKYQTVAQQRPLDLKEHHPWDGDIEDGISVLRNLQLDFTD